MKKSKLNLKSAKDEAFTESTLSEEEIFDGKVVHLYRVTVSLPNGQIATREIVRHQGAVAVMAFTSDGSLILVRQYRKAVESVQFEIPAGKIEGNDRDPFETIQRELEEETKMGAKSWTYLRKFATSIGYSSEVLYLYEANDLYEIKDPKDEDDDEFLDLEAVTFDQMTEMIEKGKILDAKTLMAYDLWRIKRLTADPLSS